MLADVLGAQVGAGPRRRPLLRGQPRTSGPRTSSSETELIQMFCDVVAKNGNLLIGIGPRPDGTIPDRSWRRCAASGRGWRPTARPSTAAGPG